MTTAVAVPTTEQQQPVIPELTSDQVRAAVYRAAIRALVGEPPGEGDLEHLLLTSFEALLMSERASAEGLPHVARQLARRAALPPLTRVLVQRMVARFVKAAGPLPPVPEQVVRRKR